MIIDKCAPWGRVLAPCITCAYRYTYVIQSCKCFSQEIRHKWKKHVLVSAVHILQKFWCRQVRNHQLYVFNFHHHRIHQLKTAIFLWKRKKLQKRVFSFDICANSLKNVIFHFCKNEKHFKMFLFHRKDASKHAFDL